MTTITEDLQEVNDCVLDRTDAERLALQIIRTIEIFLSHNLGMNWAEVQDALSRSKLLVDGAMKTE